MTEHEFIVGEWLDGLAETNFESGQVPPWLKGHVLTAGLPLPVATFPLDWTDEDGSPVASESVWGGEATPVELDNAGEDAAGLAYTWTEETGDSVIAPDGTRLYLDNIAA